ncbi:MULTISPECIES: Ldh family oxidoreductase [unclassified Micromonospora]|uniref:Ldh family oxidoreductase n=1 Tax=unclassified Micromonospora TaxID=2617518 RepID=UPI003A85AFE0
MPTFSEQELRDVLEKIYQAKGATPQEAATVARHQVEANLVGHDSHGVIRTMAYAAAIDKGHIVPGARYEIEREIPTSAVINGNWGFGFVVTERAMRETIGKARESGVAMATVHHQSHVGRLGGYATMAAEEGMIAMMMADSGLGPKSVAPFGGRTSRLGTNPICFAAPNSDGDGPVLLDMATSAVAIGKLHVARSRGDQIPTGWILDKDGKPTTDPNDYYDGGTVLPLGGDQAHKGYGLSFVVEMFCGLLTGLGFGIDPKGRHNDGIFIAVFDVARLRDLADFQRSVADFIDYLKQTPVAEGFDEVLYPGELELRTAARRRESGIEIDDATWQGLFGLLDDLGLSR